MFYLCILNAPSEINVPTAQKRHDGNVSHNDIAELVRNGDRATFADYFLGGLAHQIICQTGSDRPIGETMANRIRGDIYELWDQLTK
jgi:hypothetical protein